MKTILIVIRIMLFISLALFSLNFFLGRCGFKCGHIFNNSSSSEIPRMLSHKRVIGLLISIWVLSLFDDFLRVWVLCNVFKHLLWHFLEMLVSFLQQ